MRIPLAVARLGLAGVDVVEVKAGGKVSVNAYVRYDGRRRRFIEALPTDRRPLLVVGKAYTGAKADGDTFEMLFAPYVIEREPTWPPIEQRRRGEPVPDDPE